MSDAKSKAKAEMLKKLSSIMHDDMKEGTGKELNAKKLSKVSVIAPNKKGLEQGLSKAQELLKAKFGEIKDESEEDESEEEYEDCEECSGEGCPICEESDEE